MTRLQLGKLWTILSSILAYYALNSWIVTQGGNEIFDVKLVVSNRIPAAMIAIPICSILLALASFIGLIFAKGAGSGWANRIPVVGFDTIDTASREGRIYQAFMAAVLSVLPAFSLIHFWRLFVTARAVASGTPSKPISGVWSWKDFSWNDPARICTDYFDSPIVECRGNATLLPGLEPAIFAILTALAALMFVLQWRAILRR